MFAVGMHYHPDLAPFVIHANDPDDVPADAHLDLSRNPDGSFTVREPALLWPPGGHASRLVYRLMPWIYARLQYRMSRRDSSQLTARNFEDFVAAQRARRLNIPAAEVEPGRRASVRSC